MLKVLYRYLTTATLPTPQMESRSLGWKGNTHKSTFSSWQGGKAFARPIQAEEVAG